jgi:xanthine dehydrogenase YagS FAD-binding subunit
MNLFTYARAAHADQAIQLVDREGAKFLGGGTNLVDLMREGVERPEALVDVTGLSRDIAETERGGLLIGAAATNTAVASHPAVLGNFPMLARAMLAGASPQIRNMATVGGNVLQRTRCLYFYDHAARCNKRQPGQGCDALEGFTRQHAILGASDHCVAVHPSDMCVALVALDAKLHLLGPEARRTLSLEEFHRLPGDRPDVETQLKPGELITAVELPPSAFARRSAYRKVRDRASYAFALVSVAAAVETSANGTITDVRLALGGVAHKPWRARIAEDALRGQAATEASLRAAARAELSHAVPRPGNAFKVELAERTIVAVLQELIG